MSTSTLDTNTKSYSIRQMSPWRYGVTGLVTIFGGMGCMLYFKEIGVLPSGGPWIMVLIAGVFGLAFLLTRYIGMATTLITMDDEGVRRVWETQFPGHWQPDEGIKWTEIAEYRYQSEKNHEVFKITVADGRVIKICRTWQGGKDDFTDFRKDFVQKVEAINRRKARGEARIMMGKSFYESKTAQVMVVVGVVFLMVASLVVLVLCFYRKPHFGNFVALGAGYTAVLSFAGLVYSHRQTRKELVDSESIKPTSFRNGD